MARGRNEESENGRRLEVHQPQQQYVDSRPNEGESLNGCPVGQPVNEATNNMDRNNRSELITKHRQNSQFSRPLEGTQQYGHVKIGSKINYSVGETGAAPCTKHENGYKFKHPSSKVAYNFDSAESPMSPVHHEFPKDQVDGISCDGSNQPARQRGTATDAANPNQYHTRNLHMERDRLSTYFDWPSDVPVRPEELARQGFFYLGDRDRVECAFCGGVLHQWEAGDDPFIEHERHYSHCPFVRGEATANVPLGAPLAQISQSPSTPSTTPPVFSNPTRQQSSPPVPVSPHPVEPQSTGSGNESAFALPAGTEWPRHPDMADEQRRLSTYDTWPIYSPISPLRLARAGFLHTSVADHVRCFWCDGCLKDWRQDDDPWEEHARWYGQECGFVIINKGVAYIQDVRSRRPPVVQQPQFRWGIEASIIQSVLDMGFSEDRVQAVVQNQWQRYNRPFTSASELINALLPQEEVHVYAANEEEDPPFAFQNAPVVLPTPPPARTTPLDELPLDPETMERELRRLREERQCKVCLSEDACMVFIPCGHLCCCEHCANMLRMRGRRCPLCRGLIHRVQRAFLA